MKRRKPIARMSKKAAARMAYLHGLKNDYFLKFGLICQYCRGLFDEASYFHAHHKTKRSLGGRDELSNLVVVCGNCHIGVIHATPQALNNVRHCKANIENGFSIRETIA